MNNVVKNNFVVYFVSVIRRVVCRLVNHFLRNYRTSFFAVAVVIDVIGKSQTNVVVAEHKQMHDAILNCVVFRIDWPTMPSVASGEINHFLRNKRTVFLAVAVLVNSVCVSYAYLRAERNVSFVFVDKSVAVIVFQVIRVFAFEHFFRNFRAVIFAVAVVVDSIDGISRRFKERLRNDSDRVASKRRRAIVSVVTKSDIEQQIEFGNIVLRIAVAANKIGVPSGYGNFRNIFRSVVFNCVQKINCVLNQNLRPRQSANVY